MNSKGQSLFLSLFICFVFIISFIGLAFSQVVPEAAKAGAVEQSFQEAKKKLPQKKGVPSLEIEFAKDEIQVPDGQKILVKNFKFQGNTILSLAYLKKLARPYRYKEVSLGQLKELCNIISNAYRKRGYFLGSAYLPVQEIKDGVVTIQIIEGYLGDVKVEGAKYYNKKFLKKHFRPTTKGIISYNRLMKSLLILNDYPDLDVKAVLQPGTKPNTVDVVLKTKDKLPLHVGIDYNNFGTRYISKHRTGTNVEYSNLAFAGDKLYLRFVTGSPTRTIKFGMGEYSFPVNGYGTRLGFSYTWNEFDVQREFRALDAGGQSKIYSTYVSHPVSRTKLTNIDFNFGFDYKQVRNYLIGLKSSDDELRVFKTSITGDHIDGLNGRTYFSVAGSGGVKDIMGGSRHRDLRASRVNAGGDFMKGNLDLARYQKFLFGTYILVKASGQAASQALPIVEQFSLGGADSIRGYPQSEHMGDTAFTTTCEWRFSPPFISDFKIPLLNRTIKNTIQLLGFIDYGMAYLKNPQAGENKDYELAGMGYGTRINFTDDFSVRLDIGYHLTEKVPTDGKAPKIYVQAVAKF